MREMSRNTGFLLKALLVLTLFNLLQFNAEAATSAQSDDFDNNNNNNEEDIQPRQFSQFSPFPGGSITTPRPQHQHHYQNNQRPTADFNKNPFLSSTFDKPNVAHGGHVNHFSNSNQFSSSSQTSSFGNSNQGASSGSSSTTSSNAFNNNNFNSHSNSQSANSIFTGQTKPNKATPNHDPGVLDRYYKRYPDGSYEYRYELADGTARYERGYFLLYDNRPSLVVVGYYSYRMPDNRYITVFYNADHNGYRQNQSITPQISNLPKSIEVPRSVDVNEYAQRDQEEYVRQQQVTTETPRATTLRRTGRV